MTSEFEEKDESLQNPNEISTFRRVIPQVLASAAKSLIILNKGLYDGLAAIAIPSMLGISQELNSDETISITSLQSSWFSTLSLIGHPIGSIVSGPICDLLGRQKTMLIITIP
ncbi:facilitated trehalose transporter Tret1-like [Contarinia nasturtii]|uniref:facilitated trehalose transporter Tret1-like n=1 Tax=Contarinia nasturtii TaxID=265458 RepID=UPI0012D44B37|nr:facilitated trehalose transporter Tret1-like [Contarinia nasturtii]